MSSAAQWIWLRGLTREARHWDGLGAHWHAAGLGTFATPDLPGNGAFNAAPSSTTVRGMLEALRQRLLEVEPPAAGSGSSPSPRPRRAVLAMSLGGMVATAWAQQYPDEVERLVLVNTSMRPFNAVAERLRPGSWRDLLRIAACWNDPVRAEQAIHALTCARADARDADVAHWAQLRRSAPVTRANALRQLLAAARFEASAAPPKCPVLLLSAAGDRLVQPGCSAAVARAWGAPHQQHGWAGHDLPHDDPAWLSQQIAHWMGTGAAPA